MKNHSLVEISSIAEDFDNEVLYGDIVYQYQTSGFASFFNTTTWQRLLWLFYKVYEDTFFGKFFYQVLRQGLMRRHTITIETSPFLLKNINDNNSGFVFGFDPFYVVSDIKTLKMEFFNMYTNYTVYNHFNYIYMQQMSLQYFLNPALFDDS